MSARNDNVDMKAESATKACLEETETSNSDLEGCRGRRGTDRTKRILYDREFLIKCFHSPASTRKPNGFPIPHLDCTLGLSKVKRLPFAAPTQPYPAVKRSIKDGKDRDCEDNISLRPQSGNFSTGLGPISSSPSHISPINSFSRMHLHEDSSKGYDKDYHRGNFRRDFGGHRREHNDRNRMDRDRDMDHRDRLGRDRMSNHRNSNSWSSDGPDASDWSRRRNGAHFPKDRDYGGHGRRYSNDRRDMEEQEPEWFSGGPSSRHETIDLRGFHDDDRKDKRNDVQNGSEKSPDRNGDVDSGGESTKNENNGESPLDLSIEKILKMDHIPGFLPNDMSESEEPSGSSRFSQLFKRNSATPVPQGNSIHASNEDKSKDGRVLEMGELLRNMLFKKPAASGEPTEERRPVEPTKPAPASKDDVDAFKKLVTPLLEKVLQGSNTQSQSDKSSEEGGNVLDMFKPSAPAPVGRRISNRAFLRNPLGSSLDMEDHLEGAPLVNHPLQDIFQGLMKKSTPPPEPPQQQEDNVPVMTPSQILQTIPPEMQHLVMNFAISQWDFVQLANIAKSNEWSFHFVLDQFIRQQGPPQQRMILAGLLNLAITGRLSFPDVVVVNHHSNPGHQPIPQSMPLPNHRVPQPNFEKFIPRQDSPKEMAKRSGTPVSSMAFTPTSVMRKMTAEGTKSGAPSNSQEFVPVQPSGGLLPTPPNSTPVMNSNNPNLASLMSSMARPQAQMHYRQTPQQMMGYPPQPNFHPGMMPPNMHGPVMMPAPFQNLLPNQTQIYNNKPEDN